MDDGMNQSIKIHFLGAAGTVTGSRFLLEFQDRRILIDCGMFQGIKKVRELNWQPLPVAAADIDQVLLTHGHLDHVGSLPRLVKAGYRGEILATAPTLDVAGIILRDSARLQEEYTKRANDEGFSRHHPAEPLYTSKDVEKTLTRFRCIPEGEWIDLEGEVKVRFQYNGHILGSTFIEMEAAGKRLIFSGDVGRTQDPLLRSPKKPEEADILVLESTYGDRLHPEDDLLDSLETILVETLQKRGLLIIPSFAVERTQLLMYLFWQLHQRGSLPGSVPVIIDSPMGANVLELFRKHTSWHKLSDRQCEEMCQRFHVVRSFRETMELVGDDRPKVVIAGSGMVTGGRVLNYLEAHIGRKETTVMLAGYQAEGTRGRQLLDGSSEIKFFGKWRPVRARIDYLEGLSGHADQRELIDWASDINGIPERVFLVHGEPQALDCLRVRLKDRYGWLAHIPELYEIVDLG